MLSQIKRKTNFNGNNSFDPERQTMTRLVDSEDGYDLGSEQLKMQSQVSILIKIWKLW